MPLSTDVSISPARIAEVFSEEHRLFAEVLNELGHKLETEPVDSFYKNLVSELNDHGLAAVNEIHGLAAIKELIAAVRKSAGDSKE
ncbi:MAG: hypothetical protein AAGA09_00430 [Pseudomonadota bacterium]